MAMDDSEDTIDDPEVSSPEEIGGEDVANESVAAESSPAGSLPAGSQGEGDAEESPVENDIEESSAEHDAEESPVENDDAELVEGSSEALTAADDEDEKEEETTLVATVSSGPLEEFIEDDEEIVMDWYILKVQSNRENTICDALRRRVAVAGLERYFGEIMVPTEDIAEFKNGKKKIVKRKLYPGYIVAHMAINDDTWFLVRETPGIGDFTGSQGKPAPMLRHEVERIVKSVRPDEEEGEQVKTSIPFKLGDMVRIKEGTFENFEGKVEVIDEANGRVTVMISIFGRTTPFEAEHWQIEAI